MNLSVMKRPSLENGRWPRIVPGNVRVIALALPLTVGLTGCAALLGGKPMERPPGKDCEVLDSIVMRKPTSGGKAEFAFMTFGSGGTTYAECPANRTVDKEALRVFNTTDVATSKQGVKRVPIASSEKKSWTDWVSINGRNVQFEFTQLNFYFEGCSFWARGAYTCVPAGGSGAAPK